MEKNPQYPASCHCHLKHQQKLDDHDKAIAENKSDHKDLWDEIKNRVTNRFFVLLVLLVIGNLGFQFAIYDKINAVDKMQAIVKTKLETYIKTNNGGNRNGP